MIRFGHLLLLGSLLGCIAPPEQESDPEQAVCCWRCDRVWTEEELAAHERHRTEENLMMYASGCEYCRYHGAYKDVEFSQRDSE